MNSLPALDLGLIPAPHKEVLQRVSAEAARRAVPAYLAGGIVRDLFLQRPIKDLDLVVEGDAIGLAHALAASHGGKVTAHSEFGTATWLLPRGPQQTQPALDSIDLARARTETYEYPGALPSVAFSGIENDLRRRDFTINAMALRLEDGAPQVLDLFGGRTDLEHGLVRVLHAGSFVDDPTRMLRAIRYAQRYGFDIAPGTRRLFNDEARNVLSKLSGERLRNELDLILDEPNAAAMLAEAEALRLLSAIDPRLPGFEPAFAQLLDLVPDSAGLEIDRRTLGYLLWLMELPEDDLLALRERLAFTAELSRALLASSALFHELPSHLDARPSEWTARLDRVPAAAVYALHLRTGETAYARYLDTWRHTYAQTTGEGLKARGLTPGPRFKEILWRLRAAWLDAELSSREEENSLLESILRGEA